MTLESPVRRDSFPGTPTPGAAGDSKVGHFAAPSTCLDELTESSAATVTFSPSEAMAQLTECHSSTGWEREVW